MTDRDTNEPQGEQTPRPDRDRVAVIGGRGWASAFAALLASHPGPHVEMLPPELRYPSRLRGERIPLPDPSFFERRDAQRRERRRREDEARERRLRERIAEGRDDRADKYLHASARRRRAAQGTDARSDETRSGSAGGNGPVGEAEAPR